jgi:hypothetical protein
VVVILLQLIVSACTRGNPVVQEDDASVERRSLGSRFQKHLDDMGGREIFTFRLARLLSLIGLVSLSAYTIATRKYTPELPYPMHMQLALLGVYVSPHTIHKPGRVRTDFSLGLSASSIVPFCHS